MHETFKEDILNPIYIKPARLARLAPLVARYCRASVLFLMNATSKMLTGDAEPRTCCPLEPQSEILGYLSPFITKRIKA